MNLVDFEVTKIISEQFDKVYKLLGYTEEEMAELHQEAIRNLNGKELLESDELKHITFLRSDGVCQEYEYNCYGSIRTTKRIATIDKRLQDEHPKPYVVGDTGLC